MGIVVATLTGTGTASAQVLERVLMPGPVILGHAEYEDTCSSCHQPFARDSQRALCLDCHTAIDDDIDTSMGFHGRSTTIPTIECAACHTEHEGRDADVVGLDRDTFDHAVTNFPLLGSHTIVGCENCHAPAAKYREAATTCIDCHAEEDRHAGNLGEKCDECHTETRWSDTSFDHDTTDFALTGHHIGTSCGGCHRNESYVDTPAQCVACHRIDDVHAGRNGNTCQDCHTPEGWTDTSFDHFEATGFALANGHGGLACTACHEDATFTEPPDPGCYACHRADDVHAGNNGLQCDTCHAPTSWPEVSFDHASDAGFALNGTHGTLACTACHRGSVETARPDPACNSCHWTDDVHQSRLGTSCQTCHSETGWGEAVRFDHDITEFPLLGLHAAVACEGCHADATFQDTPVQCIDCHEGDDVHSRKLGFDCAMCHNPNDWLIWVFDHGTRTEFPLDGAHENLDCLACHNRPVTDSVALSMSCGSCHRGDDIHATAFGMDCGLCHTTEAFEELR
jgi:hypothetical protein